MSNLDRASNPSLTPAEFKELLELQDLDVYEALDLNEIAAERYLAWLETQPEVEYFPYENLSSQEINRLADAGDHRAQFNKAIEEHEAGNIAASSEWFKKSGENGNIVSAFNYALTLSSEGEQLLWFKKGAFKGMPEAQREVGRICYEQGDSVSALIWFGLAIRRDSEMALNDMGIVHWSRGESDEAIHYWNRAVALGNQDAQENLNMAADRTLFDDLDLDFDYLDNSTYTPAPVTNQNTGHTEVQTSKKSGFEIL